MPPVTHQTFFAFLLLALAPCAFGQTLKQFDLLNSRLTVSMPRGSITGSRDQGMMAAPEPVERESMIVYEDSGNKLVLLARELFKIEKKPGVK